MSKVSIKEALDALGTLEKSLHPRANAAAVGILAQFIAEKAWSAAPKSNTGLPCPYCEEPLEKLSIVSNNDGTTTVRINAKLTKKELEALPSMLKMFGKR